MINDVDVLELYVRNRLGKSLWLKNDIPYAPEHTIPHYQLHISRGLYLRLGMGSDRALNELLTKDLPKEVGVYQVISRIVSEEIVEARKKMKNLSAKMILAVKKAFKFLMQCNCLKTVLLTEGPYRYKLYGDCLRA